MLSIDQALHNTCSAAACISQNLPFVYKSEKKLFLVLSCFMWYFTRQTYFRKGERREIVACFLTVY